jgi:hypothetical protein
MPNGHVLELSSLRERHPPIGTALLHAFAPAAIIRLSIDPTPQPSGTMSRRAEVDWITRPGTNPAVQVHRDIGWNGLKDLLGRLCVQLPFTVNAQTLTEQAAIGVMALLINDLEGAVLQTVLPIGSGGDYFVLPPRGRKPIQMEVSGIREDSTGTASRARLAQKAEQVLTHSQAGFASVTTFSHKAGPIAHSYLHYVSSRRRKKKGGKKGKKT